MQAFRRSHCKLCAPLSPLGDHLVPEWRDSLDIQAITRRVYFGPVKMAVSRRATISQGMLNNKRNATI
jgi:hypothetical protein